MTNIIVSLAIVVVLTLAIGKLVMNKRKGSGCSGCSEKGSCSSKPRNTD